VNRPRLLDLFCGAGGCSVGYHRAGFDVVGVDIDPHPTYPFEFHQADALTFPLDGFDVIHASPPCQAHSSLKARWRDREHADHVDATRARLVATGLPYVIENVVGAPLRLPFMLCGSSFGLGVRRHRLFESNVFVMAPPCAHGQQEAQFDVYEHGRWIKSTVARVYGHGGGKANDRWDEAMGIDWMDKSDLAQAIPPAYTEHIGHYLLNAVNARAAA
jgi:DNA (cytosine-5)-methyltransferase 1